jgi:hypothetical protein
VIALFLLLALQGVGDDPPWNQYRPSTFREILAELEPFAEGTRREAEPGREWSVINLGAGRLRVVAVFTGERRPVPVAHARLLDLWGKAAGRGEISRYFVEEIRVREGERSHWVALQGEFAAHLHEDVRAGDPVELFLVCPGAMNGDWVFMANAFDQVAAQPAPVAPGDGGAGEKKPAP